MAEYRGMCFQDGQVVVNQPVGDPHLAVKFIVDHMYHYERVVVVDDYDGLEVASARDGRPLHPRELVVGYKPEAHERFVANLIALSPTLAGRALD